MTKTQGLMNIHIIDYLKTIAVIDTQSHILMEIAVYKDISGGVIVAVDILSCPTLISRLTPPAMWVVCMSRGRLERSRMSAYNGLDSQSVKNNFF